MLGQLVRIIRNSLRPTFYVDPANGDDWRNNGRSPDKAFRSERKAIYAACSLYGGQWPKRSVRIQMVWPQSSLDVPPRHVWYGITPQ